MWLILNKCTGENFLCLRNVGYLVCLVLYQRIFFMARQPLVGQDLLIVEATRSHLDTPHSVGLLGMSNRSVAGTSTLQHTTPTRDRHP